MSDLIVQDKHTYILPDSNVVDDFNPKIVCTVEIVDRAVELKKEGNEKNEVQENQENPDEKEVAEHECPSKKRKPVKNHAKNIREVERDPIHFDAKMKIKASLRKSFEMGKDFFTSGCKVKMFECSKCSSKFIKKSELKSHINSVHLKSFDCLKCDRKFMKEKSLKIHDTMVHKQKKILSCSKCNAKFGQKCDLISHMSDVHQPLRSYVCLQCNCYFGSKCQLKKHLATGHEVKGSNFECSKCHVGFEQESDLKLHINIAHDKNEIVFVLEQKKPFACKVCLATFKNENSLKSHIKRAHEKKYKCSICDHKFAMKIEWENHRIACLSTECRFCDCPFSSGMTPYHKTRHMSVCRKEDFAKSEVQKILMRFV